MEMKMQKQVHIQEAIRDPDTNDITHFNQALGVTDDDGITCVIPNGYVPLIETTAAEDITVTLIPTTAAEDITVTLIPPQTQITPATLVSRVNDAEANTSTLVFTFPEA